VKKSAGGIGKKSNSVTNNTHTHTKIIEEEEEEEREKSVKEKENSSRLLFQFRSRFFRFDRTVFFFPSSFFL
jgi:hypothetical protein